jgi:hypothetical protein
MKKSLLIIAVIVMTIPFIRCSSGGSSSNSDGTINHADIYGWWYPNPNLSIPHYKAYYFGQDGVYKQDQTNFGLGIGLGTWEWQSSNVVKMTPTPNGGIAGGPVTGTVYKLTTDSLVFASEELRLSRVQH